MELSATVLAMDCNFLIWGLFLDLKVGTIPCSVMQTILWIGTPGCIKIKDVVIFRSATTRMRATIWLHMWNFTLMWICQIHGSRTVISSFYDLPRAPNTMPSAVGAKNHIVPLPISILPSSPLSMLSYQKWMAAPTISPSFCQSHVRGTRNSPVRRCGILRS